MAKNSFVLYYTYREQLKDLSDEDLGKLLRALFDYEIDRVKPKLSGGVQMAFNFIQSTLDLDRLKYEEKCNKNRENIIKYWKNADTNENERIRMNTMATDNDNDNCLKEKEIYNKEREKYIVQLFEQVWNIYPRKESKEQGLKTWKKKLASSKTKDDILERARHITSLLISHKNNWKLECREKKFLPLFSSWLNSNVPDKE